MKRRLILLCILLSAVSVVINAQSANNQYRLGSYSGTANLRKQILEMTSKAFGTNQIKYAGSLNMLALSQYRRGNYSEAVRLGEQALAILGRELGTGHSYYATSLANLAGYQNSLGNYSEAVRLGEQALEIRGKVLGTEHPDYAASLNNLALYQFNLGNSAEALRLGEQATIMLGKTLGLKHLKYATSLANLALYQFYSGNYVETLRLSEQALAIFDKELGMEHPEYASSLVPLAMYQAMNGNYSEAIRLSEQILAILGKVLGTNHPYYASSLAVLAFYQAMNGNYSEAVRLGEQALAIFGKELGEEHPECALPLFVLAISNCEAGNGAVTGNYVWQCSNNLGNLTMRQFGELTSTERSIFWNKYSGWYTKYLNKYVYTYPTDTLCFTAYNGALLSKGLIQNSEIEIRKLLQESGDAEIDTLYEEMYINKLHLQRLYEKPIAERYISTDSLEQVVNKQESELMQKSKVYGDYTKNLRINWKDVRGKLTEKDVAVEFASFPLNNDSTMYMALVLKKDMECPKMVRLFEEKQIKGIRNPYSNKYIASLVWQPLAEYINNAEDVYFGASGELYNIAIEQVPHWSENCLMSDRWNIYRLSSTRELALIKEKDKVKRASVYGGIKYDTDTLMLSNDSKKYGGKREMSMEMFDIADSLNLRTGVKYLPATKTEAENIDKTLEQKHIATLLKLDTLATEGAFKDLSGKKMNLLHIATHGFYWTEREANYNRHLDFLMLDAKRPKYVEDKAMTRSGLLFAGANNALTGKKLPEGVNDGILTAKEISQLDLRGLDLVVLSACQTGLGEIKGDGVFGLQRGFKKAGANSLMMSLWKVDDNATQMLMTEFYKNLTSGKSKHESLKLAQKYVREYEKEVEVTNDTRPAITAHAKEQARKEAVKEKQYKKIHPYESPEYWAAFILLDAID